MADAETIKACLSDKLWRLRNLYQILPEDDSEGGLIPFVPRAEQESFLARRHNRNFVPKARKLGMSTLIVLDFLDECIWTPNTHCAHVDFKEDDAFKKLDIAKTAWKYGPYHPNPVAAAIWKGIHERNPLINDATGVMKWANGSKQEAGTSFMGGTPRRLHWSEAGPMSAQAPERASKVKRGSLNAVGKNGIIDVETTMEGGPYGIAYDMFKLALDMEGQELSPMDWRLHFFPWYGHPSYVLAGHEPKDKRTFDYAAELREKYGIELPPERWAWYEAKRREQGDDIWTQFPTVPDECVRSVVTGQIYPQIITLRSQRRVTQLAIEPQYPLYTFWDIGVSDATACWLGQMPGRDVLWHDYYEGSGHGASGAADVIRRLEQKHGRPIARHFFPHDVDYRDKGSGKTYRQQLVEAGIPNELIATVPRSHNLWDGINDVRDRIPRMWFSLACAEDWMGDDGEKHPSGLGCLEGYRLAPRTSTGIIRDMPLHDHCSHGADAMRTYAQADDAGMIRPATMAGVANNIRKRSGTQQGGFVG